MQVVFLFLMYDYRVTMLGSEMEQKLKQGKLGMHLRESVKMKRNEGKF